MSNPSLGSSIASAMVDAAHGAVLGEVIGQARSDAQQAGEKAKQWYEYAQKLEAQNRSLQAALGLVEAQRDEALAKLSLSEYNLAKYKSQTEKVDERNYEILNQNIEYGKRVKNRLKQMEKALQHSSADQASLKVVMEAYTQLVEKMNLEGSLPPDLKENAEVIWNNFMSGGQLAATEKVKAIVDEAPAATPTRMAMF